jgi:hypothetical protein
MKLPNHTDSAQSWSDELPEGFFVCAWKILWGNSTLAPHIYDNEQLADIRREVNQILSLQQSDEYKNNEIKKIVTNDDYLQRQREGQFLPLDTFIGWDWYSTYWPNSDPSISFEWVDYASLGERILTQIIERNYKKVFPRGRERYLLKNKSKLPIYILKEEVIAFRNRADSEIFSYKEIWDATLLVAMILFQSTNKEDLYESAEELQNLIDIHVGYYTTHIEYHLQHEFMEGASTAFKAFLWKKILLYGSYYRDSIQHIYESIRQNIDQNELSLFYKHILAHYYKPVEESQEQIESIKIIFDSIVKNADNTGEDDGWDVLY